MCVCIYVYVFLALSYSLFLSLRLFWRVFLCDRLFSLSWVSLKYNQRMDKSELIVSPRCCHVLLSPPPLIYVYCGFSVRSRKTRATLFSIYVSPRRRVLPIQLYETFVARFLLWFRPGAKSTYTALFFFCQNCRELIKFYSKPVNLYTL